MTTPARCHRDYPHADHPIGRTDRDCPGVEPPAVVEATPDPRLDVPTVYRPFDLPICTVKTPHEHHTTPMANGASLVCFGVPDGSAPAGLSAAQEIRLELARVYGYDGGTPEEGIAKATTWAAWVEHGPDETPALRDQRDLYAKLAEANADAARAHNRADLAEARLGHIADALRDWSPKSDFGNAVRDALAWTPDDTATADRIPVAGCSRCGQDWNKGSHGEGFCLPSAPAGAATGDE